MLSKYYTPETCQVLSAADEGVVQGLNPNFALNFCEKGRGEQRVVINALLALTIKNVEGRVNGVMKRVIVVGTGAGGAVARAGVSITWF